MAPRKLNSKSLDKLLSGQRELFGGRRRKLIQAWTQKARVSRTRKGTCKLVMHQGIGA